jgi:GNAT superfamily N-acetyltransferase
MSIRQYGASDRDRMLAIFDANTPQFFAVDERADFSRYLDENGARYEVCERDGAIVAGFAIAPGTAGRAHLNWILVDPSAQGGGIGKAMMQAALKRARDQGAAMLDIAASQHSAPFFLCHGARALARIDDGWGPGMHRIDMELALGV